MTLKEASKLRLGQSVLWPDGANGCGEEIGVVTLDSTNDAKYVEWPDGQRTYLHDEYAVRLLREIPQ